MENWETGTAAGKAAQAFLNQTALAKTKGGCIKTLALPKVFTREDIAIFQQIAETMYRILAKITVHYKENPQYRKLFPFSEEMEQWICIDTGYASVIPIMRMDIHYHEDTKQWKFCEINTDGTSAMIEELLLHQAFSLPEEERFGQFELFDSWVRTVSRIYAAFAGRVPDPHVAIVDFLDKGYLPEFAEFEKRFRENGYSAEICDIRELTYQNGALYSPSGKQIHIIYRRAVTSDIAEHAGEVRPFLQAAKEQAVCLIGGLQTQVAHNKALFYVMRHPMTRQLLTAEEAAFLDAHVPFTAKIGELRPEELIENREQWIIKPLDSYGASGVFAGLDYSDAEWENLIRLHRSEDYIVQEYYHPFLTWNVDCTGAEPKTALYGNQTGLFVYDGQFAGIYSRLSDGNTIVTNRNERAVPVYVL